MTGDRKIRTLAKHLVALSQTEGLLDEAKVTQVLEHLASSQRRGLRRILKTYLFFIKREIQNTEIRVEHAGPVSEATLEGIRSGFSEAYGRPLRLRSRENADLIAGLRIQIGDDLIDGSISARLKVLESTL